MTPEEAQTQMRLEAERVVSAVTEAAAALRAMARLVDHLEGKTDGMLNKRMFRKGTINDYAQFLEKRVEGPDRGEFLCWLLRAQAMEKP